VREGPPRCGPYNITAPNPARSCDFTTALARELGRRTVLRLPIWTLRLTMGQVAPEVLGSLRVIPDRLTKAGFTFHHPEMSSALRAALDHHPGPPLDVPAAIGSLTRRFRRHDGTG
jgi:NAD dependent epimerase/dehydratase family enzyme